MVKVKDIDFQFTKDVNISIFKTYDTYLYDFLVDRYKEFISNYEYLENEPEIDFSLFCRWYVLKVLDNVSKCFICKE